MSQLNTMLRLDEFIGQTSIKERCLALMEMDTYSILLRGFWGMGKTTLAIALAWHKGFAHIYTAPLNGARLDLDVISIIDEAHRLDFEPLYEVIPDGKFIFCTNMASKVPEPFLSRTHEFRLRDYTIDELRQIVEVHSDKFEGELAEIIARRSRGNPRIAAMLTEKLEQMIRWGRQEVTDKTLVRLFENKLEIDSHGMDNLDRQYLKSLKTGPKSQRTLQAILQVDDRHLERMERFLLREGKITITSKGRSLV